MSRRAQDRREQREANRRCATASDLERLDRHYRKLPDDYPAIVRAKERARKGGYELTEAQLDKLLKKSSTPLGRMPKLSGPACGGAESSGSGRGNSPRIQGKSREFHPRF